MRFQASPPMTPRGTRRRYHSGRRRPGELSEMIRIFDHAGVDATFVMTFVAPLNPCSDDPMFDLDMANYSLVRSYGGRLGPLGAAHPDAPWDRERLGGTYRDMPWEPKASFRAVADSYALQAQR